MIFQSQNNLGSNAQLHKLAAVLIVFLLTSFAVIPEVDASCQTPPAATETINWLGCEDATTGDGGFQALTINVPAGLTIGDTLIAAIAIDGNVTLDPLAGWVLESRLNRGAALTQAIYSRVVDGTEPGSYTINWNNGEEAYGFILHFDGAMGVSVLGTTGRTTTPVFPSLFALNDDMILRIGAFDDDDINPDTYPIFTGGTDGNAHTDITIDESTSTGGNASASASYRTVTVAGAVGTKSFNFTGGSSEQWITTAVLLSAVLPPPSCPSDQYPSDPGQLVILEECVETKIGFNSNTIGLATPAATAVGDLLIAVMTADGNRAPLTAPAATPAWSNPTNIQNSGVTVAVFTKLAVLADLSSTTTFNLNGAEVDRSYSYMLALSGASGRVTASNGQSVVDNLTAIANAIVTAADQTLVVQTAGNDQDDIVIGPAATIIAGATNIGADVSSIEGSAVASQAVYRNFPTAASAVSAANFTLLSPNKEWISVTLGVEPIEFRFVHDGSLSLCAIQEVEIRAVDSQNNPIVDFAGTVTLVTTGDAGGFGTWATGTTPDQA